MKKTKATKKSPKTKSEDKKPVVYHPEVVDLEVESSEEKEDFLDDDVEQAFFSDDKALVTKASSDFLPVKTSHELKTLDTLDLYIKEISRYDLLTPEEELKLTRELVSTGDIEIAKKLVKANLRLVVKIALEYRHAYQNVLDLIQEGNIGLMKAVSKYDPEKGAKLSYYASWWIKSYILKFILDNFRLVKIGTTAEQKKLFYNLMREKERLSQMGITPDTKQLSEHLGVSEKALIEMETRLSPHSGDLSLDLKATEDSRETIGDLLQVEGESIDEKLANEEGLVILQEHLEEFLNTLKDRDREIFTKRLLSEIPMSLQAIADEYGVSRERIRQVEERLIAKLKVYMASYLG